MEATLLEDLRWAGLGPILSSCVAFAFAREDMRLVIGMIRHTRVMKRQRWRVN